MWSGRLARSLNACLVLPQEPDGSVRGEPALRERASDRTRLSAPFGALGPGGQVLPMTPDSRCFYIETHPCVLYRSQQRRSNAVNI